MSGADNHQTEKSKMIRSALLALVTIAMTASPAIAEPVQWTTASGGNGHWYEFVDNGSSISWQDARTNAEQLGGYLVTLGSTEENDWVLSNIVVPAYPENLPGIDPTTIGGPWIGAFEDPNDGWTWVTGEPWWGAPSSAWLCCDGDFLHYWRWSDASGSQLHWNDAEPGVTGGTDLQTQWGWYVVEFESDPSSQPSITVIDFDALPTGFIDPFSINGYSITTAGYPNTTYNQAVTNVGGANQNVVVDGSPQNDFGTSMEITRIDGASFRLISLDIANLAASATPGSPGLTSCPLGGYVLRVNQVVSGTGSGDMVGRCDAYFPTSSTFMTVPAEPLAESVTKLWLDIVGNSSSNWAFDKVVVETVTSGCTSIGSLSPSTSSLAADQNNHCEDWFGVSQPGADLRNAVLSLADLGSANLAGSLFINADLSGASLVNASLVNARLEGANLRGTAMTAANLSFANLTGALYDELTIFPSGNAYDLAPSGLDGGATPWAARMVPTPEPGLGAMLTIGAGGLFVLTARNRSRSSNRFLN